MLLRFVVFLGSGLLIAVKGQAQRELRYSIYEEIEVGSTIGDVMNDAEVARRHGHDVRRSLRFRFLSQPPCPIVIDSETGLLRTGGRVDREAVCQEGQESQCLIRMDVAVTPMVYFTIVKVCVEIKDINDNDPEFHPNFKVHEIPESSPVGTLLLLPVASDLDVGRFSVQTYQLLADLYSIHFELNVIRKPDKSTDLRLVLVKALDRETVDVHRLTVTAFDGEVPPRSGSLDVTVIVVDANDNPPVFEYSSYEVTVTENLAAFTTVAKVKAVDRDVGRNAEVTYFLSAPSEANYGDVFSVNSTSGEVVVIGEVDFEFTAVYRLMISAKDGGHDPVTADTMVTVRVEDANDNAPEITVNSLVASNTDVASVPESVNSDTFVAHVTVVDPDSGLNGRFNCTLDSGHFRLTTGDGEYQVVTKEPLDRELRSRYGLELACMDGGHPSLTTIKRLRVDVLDINDNSPRFQKAEYSAEILENNFVGAYVCHVTANDRDDGDNAKLHYHLAADMEQYLDIDSMSGLIRAKSRFDRETLSRFRFAVYARDHGLPARTGSTVVVLTVLDVNDEPPRFDAESYSMGIEENRPIGLEVGVLGARDADSFPMNQFSFYIHGGSQTDDAFDIDPTTGRITTNQVLDREEREVYLIRVVVRDDESPSLTSSTTVTVYVIDVNDNVPRWIEPRHDRFTAIVPTRAPIGFTVSRLEATDPDAGANGQVTYTLEPDSHYAGLFDIDQASRRVTVLGDLRGYPDNTTFLLTIIASDRGYPVSRNSSRILRVSVSKTEAMSFSGTPDRRDDYLPLRNNLVVVVALASATAILSVIFLMVIACLVRRSKSRGDCGHQKYNCRIETLKAMAASDEESLKPSLPAAVDDPSPKGLRITLNSFTGLPIGDAVTQPNRRTPDVTSTTTTTTHPSMKQFAYRDVTANGCHWKPGNRIGNHLGSSSPVVSKYTGDGGGDDDDDDDDDDDEEELMNISTGRHFRSPVASRSPITSSLYDVTSTASHPGDQCSLADSGNDHDDDDDDDDTGCAPKGGDVV